MKRVRKFLIIGLFCLVCVLTNQASFAADYDINTFNDGSINSLKNHTPAFASGDTVNITTNLTATSAIGDVLSGGGTITIQGANSGISINGADTYSGFTVNSGKTYNINSLGLNDLKSSYGGSAYNYGTLNTNSSTFTSNASSNSGGAIYSYFGKENITGSTFTSNTAGGAGGAIYSYYGTGETVTGSTFTNNTAAYYGGAIYNTENSNSAPIIITDSIFTGNKATLQSGGAIYSGPNPGSSMTITITGSTFTNNTAPAYGGAVGNGGGGTMTTTIDNSDFSGNKATYGGAVYSYLGSAAIIDSTFENNTATAYGGAFCSSRTTSTITNSEFTGNTATGTGGGAVYTYLGTSSITDSTFTGNSALKYGGAIENYSNTATMSGLTFSNNTSKLGGAIYDYNSTATLTNSTFTGNTATSTEANSGGGAIYNSTGSSLHATGCTFGSPTDSSLGNKATAPDAIGGGAIYNNSALLIDGSSKFYYNTSATAGGAICNNTNGNLNIQDSTIINNTANDGGALANAGTATLTNTIIQDNTATTNGGGIYNLIGTTTVENSTITNNTAGNGGAVSNTDNGTVVLTDTIIQNNTATTNGGAINNDSGTVTVNAVNQDAVFSGNTASGLGNDVYTSGSTTRGTINFNAGEGRQIVINDGVVGETSDINKNGAGDLVLNAAISPVSGATDLNVNLNQGMTILSNDSYLNGTNLTFNGGNLNTQNSTIGNINLNSATFNSAGNWLIDVDLASQTGDFLNPTTVTDNGGILTISSIKNATDTSATTLIIPVANTAAKYNVTSAVTTVYGPIYAYSVAYVTNLSNNLGDLVFTRTGFAPGVTAPSISQNATFLLQSAIDAQFFNNVDTFMSFPIAQRESTICCQLSDGNITGAACPISGNGTFSPIYDCELNRGIWIKQFASFEDIPFQGGPRSRMIQYATMVGLDSRMHRLKKGWVGNTSAFVGYLGSNQNFDNVGIQQDGGMFGLAENMVKGMNFVSVIANLGGSLGTGYTNYGNDYFNSYFAGASVKAGHNIEFKEGDYIIQPNLFLAYMFVNMDDYTSSSGVNVTSKPLNAVQVAPGIRFIKNMHEKGQVYLAVNFVYNVLDRAEVSLNDVALPYVSIAPYVEYGLGYQRAWAGKYLGFIQALVRGGGRNGLALQFGLRSAF